MKKKKTTKKTAVKKKKETTTAVAPKKEVVERMKYPQEKMIEQAIWNAKTKQKSMWQTQTNRASELGHPCLRYLYYLRTCPVEKRKMYDTTLQFIFDIGKVLEDVSKKDLREAGFQIYDVAKSKHWKKYNITGMVDTRIHHPLDEKKIVPVEIKSINHFLWLKLKDIDDFFTDKRVWVQKYPAQLMVYCLLENAEEGMFLLKDKLTGEYKVIWLYFENYTTFADKLIRKAEAINEAVDKEKAPERRMTIDNIVYQGEEICDRCQFFNVCMPDKHFGGKLELLKPDPEAEDKLKRFFELRSNAKEYLALEKELKAHFKQFSKDKMNIGDFIITIKEYHNDGGTKVTPPYDYKVVKFKQL